MLPGDEDLLDLELFDDLVAQLQLDRVAELGEVAAEDQEVRGRVHRLDVVDRAHGLLDEAGVDLLGRRCVSEIQANLKVSVAPPSCAYAMSMVLIRGSQPAVAAAAAAAEQRPVDEDPPRGSTWLSGLTPGRHSVRRISRRAF